MKVAQECRKNKRHRRFSDGYCPLRHLESSWCHSLRDFQNNFRIWIQVKIILRLRVSDYYALLCAQYFWTRKSFYSQINLLQDATVLAIFKVAILTDPVWSTVCRLWILKAMTTRKSILKNGHLFCSSILVAVQCVVHTVYTGKRNSLASTGYSSSLHWSFF